MAQEKENKKKKKEEEKAKEPRVPVPPAHRCVSKQLTEGTDKVRSYAFEGRKCRELQDQLDLGGDPNGIDLYPEFTPPLHLACAAGNLDEVKILLRTASRKRDDEETRKKKEEQMVRFPDHPDRGGRTPLHLATIEGSVPICRLLLDTGALHTATDQYGVTPLHTACGNGHFRLVEMLLKHAEGHEAPGLYPTLVWKRMYINQPNAHNKDTPLHVACRSGHPWAAKMLVDYIKGKIGFPSKASAQTMSMFINAKNKDGRTPLDLAVFGRLQDAELMLKRINDVIQRMGVKSRTVAKPQRVEIEPNRVNKHKFQLS